MHFSSLAALAPRNAIILLELRLLSSKCVSAIGSLQAAGLLEPAAYPHLEPLALVELAVDLLLRAAQLLQTLLVGLGEVLLLHLTAFLPKNTVFLCGF